MKRLLLLALPLLALGSCGEEAQQEETMTEKTEEATGSLKQQLDAKKQAWEETATDEKKKIYKEGIASVAESGILQNALQVGSKAPDFTLTNASGEAVSLSSYLAKGPVVLTWYRGGWCPYCNMTLHELQNQLPAFKAEGAHMLALTPELPDKSLSTKEKHSLEFEVLSDVDNKVARQYGIVFKLTPDVATSYQKSFDLHGYNGNETDELPLAATYIIDQQGVVRYAFLDADYRKRAEPATLLAELKKL